MNLRFACIFLIAFTSRIFAQVNELGQLQKDLYNYVNTFKLSKPSDTASNSNQPEAMKMKVEESLDRFIQKRESNTLDSLCLSGVKAGSMYTIQGKSYELNEVKRNIWQKAIAGNVNYCIAFYGVYNFSKPNFIQLFIQPFQVGLQNYVVYSLNLNGKNRYSVKEVSSNKVVYTGNCESETAALSGLFSLDSLHNLIIEEPGGTEQRALVVNIEGGIWKPVPAFKGKSLAGNKAGAKQNSQRTYLVFALNNRVNNMYGYGFKDRYKIVYSKETGQLSYRKYLKNIETGELVQSGWKNGFFVLDDYDFGAAVAPAELPAAE